MAITPPVPDQEVSTSGWGIPITDEVNRMTPLVVAPSGWANITFQNGWSSYLQAQYRKVDNDVVQLRGYIVSPGGSSIIATLPVGFRPLSVNVAFYVSPWIAGGVTPNSIGIETNGNMTPALAITSGASFSITGMFFSTL